MKKILILLVGAVTVATVLTGCGDSQLEAVKNGYLGIDNSRTIEQAFSANLKNIRWRKFTTENNQTIVEAVGVWKSKENRQNIEKAKAKVTQEIIQEKEKLKELPAKVEKAHKQSFKREYAMNDEWTKKDLENGLKSSIETATTSVSEDITRNEARLAAEKDYTYNIPMDGDRILVQLIVNVDGSFAFSYGELQDDHGKVKQNEDKTMEASTNGCFSGMEFLNLLYEGAGKSTEVMVLTDWKPQYWKDY